MSNKTITRPHLEALKNVASAAAMREALVSSRRAFASGVLPAIVIVGAAPEGARLIDLCKANAIKVLAVCDGDRGKWGHDFNGYPVRPVGDAVSWGPDQLIVIASHKPLASVKQLTALGARNVVPFALLQILHPQLYPPHMFYVDWFEDLFDNRDRYMALVDAMAGDELSLSTLDAIIGFRQTMDVTLLEPILDLKAFLSPDLVTFLPGGTYIDGGAYDGDTVRKYIAAADGKFGRIIAFEPDPETYRRLVANFADDKRVEPMNIGLHRRRDVLRFVNDSSRAALLSDGGEIEVPVVNIDEVLKGAPVNYIKLNIEGAELATLEGAQESIRRHRPILAISAYHAPDHLWRVPELIHAIVPSYKLHLRQQESGCVEPVVYAIPA
jgi:FkbM family methyltransferase